MLFFFWFYKLSLKFPISLDEDCSYLRFYSDRRVISFSICFFSYCKALYLCLCYSWRFWICLSISLSFNKDLLDSSYFYRLRERSSDYLADIFSLISNLSFSAFLQYFWCCADNSSKSDSFFFRVFSMYLKFVRS